MSKKKSIKHILFIGMSGGLAKITAALLLKHYPEIKITGVDSRPFSESSQHPDPLEKKIKFYQINYTRGQFESLFRDHQFDAIIHLGRLSHAQADRISLSERLDLNLMGTNRILDLALKNKVKKVVILSTFHVYGALNDNPIYMNEDHPLRASIKYPELRDVVEMDQIATNWMWRYQGDIQTVVLRPCNIIGPQISNTMTRYLQAPYAPVPLDFNPMLQFVHEFDMSRVIVESIFKVPTGVYNVAPEETIALRETKRLLDLPSVAVPLVALEQIARFIKSVWSFPDYLLDYIKYSSVIDGQKLIKHIEDEKNQDSFFRFSTREAIEHLKK